MTQKKLGLVFAIFTTITWGLWGALIEIPQKSGFPATLGYVVWAITMIIPAIIALAINKWKLEYNLKSIIYGCIIGLLGAGGQLILFTGALTKGPAYIIFPIISLSPVFTILLSALFLKERASKKGWVGIVIALIAIPLLSYSEPQNNALGNKLWLFYALMVFAAWGAQAYFMKLANQSMKAESIFFYMMITGLLLTPVALWMTDFSQHINYGLKGPYATFAIQILNSVGSLLIVYAFRYGKAIIISPLTNAAAPLITIVLSLIIYSVFPHYIIIIGMSMALISVVLLSLDE